MEVLLDFIGNKKIKVGVVFEEASAKILPKWFIRDGRQYTIERVTYTWEEKKGRGLIKHFAVMAENTHYELTYDTHRTLWHLASVGDEE